MVDGRAEDVVMRNDVRPWSEGKPPEAVRQASVELYTATCFKRRSKSSTDARHFAGTTRGTWIDLTAERSST